jgi:hypothetical protein
VPPTAAPKPPTAVPPTAAPVSDPKPELDSPADDKDGSDEIELAPSKRAQTNTENQDDDTADKPETKKALPTAPGNSDSPSILYLVLAVATLLFVAAAGVITSVHYLYFEQQMDYRDVISVLHNAK